MYRLAVLKVFVYDRALSSLWARNEHPSLIKNKIGLEMKRKGSIFVFLTLSV
jgi:hypothetical protein